MKRLIQPAANCLLAAFAMAWPWDVYQYVPWVGIHITGLAALGLIVLWVADVTLNRRNRVPFELAWPAIALLGYVSFRIEEPWLVAVGGPLLYGLSHLVFLLGMVLAGTQYTRPFLRWAARRAVERWGRPGTSEPEPPPSVGEKP